MKMDSKKFNLIFLLILVLQIVTMCLFGIQKAGYHQDEYYSYFSTNRSLGFYYPDREWVDTDTLKNEFEVLKGEGFNYGLVHLVQSWDVHPPLFYDFLHTVCSLTPGVFSKWQGLLVNLIAFVISYLLLNALAKSVGMNRGLRLILMFSYGFNPMTISCVMFIRMYMWLTVFVLSLALCHMRLISLIKNYYAGSELTGFKLAKPFDKRFKKGFAKCVINIAAVSFLGFMTQYYFLIFMVMIGLSFVIWFLFLMPKNRKKSNAASGVDEDQKQLTIEGILNDEQFVAQAASMAERFMYIVFYGIGCAVSLGCAVLVYPASLSHIFRGYRGQEAQAAFADGSNILERLGFFYGLARDYLFAGFDWLIIILVVIALIGLFFLIRIKGEKDKLHIAHIRILAATAAGYFIVVAKTALLLGETSNRYEMPIYPIMLLLAVYFVRIGMRAIVGNRKAFGIVIPYFLTFLVFALITAKGLLADHNVLFLYPEDRARISYAKEVKEQGIPVVVMFNEKTPDNIWRLTDELLEYDKLYYISEDNTADIADAEIKNADEIIVYAADHENRDVLMGKIEALNQNYQACDVLYTKEMWTVYKIK